MTLPKIDVPSYSLDVLSTNSNIRYRPFLVKEEKILLLALESGESEDIITAIQQMIEACILEGDINVSELPLFDLENIFLNIRAKSVGETSELNVPCISDDCEEYTTHSINLDEIELIKDETHTSNIIIKDKIGVIMKYPSVSGLADIDMDIDNDIEQTLNLILTCIESVYDGENEYDFRDYTLEERNSFVESLTQQQLALIQNFFNTMPSLQYQLEFKCDTCNTEGNIPIIGLQNFFS